jgi:putative ABC transport system ATP-binding protein
VSEPAARIRDLVRTYGSGDALVRALDGVSLDLGAGEFTAIMGPSGSGKSTLMHCAAALDRADSGTVHLGDEEITRLGDRALTRLRRDRIGFVFQSYNLIPVLTARENVEYPLVLQGVGAEERERAAHEALKWVGLEAYADRRPDLLSGGQQQRVAVARAIVHRPALVLADEPTANLDSKTGAALLDLMESLNREHGVTFLFSSHDQAVLVRARRVIHLLDGALHGEEVRAR